MNAQPAVLSIAVLASFALAMGGGWLVAKRRDRKRGALTIVMALVLLVNVLIWTLPGPAWAVGWTVAPEAASQRST